MQIRRYLGPVDEATMKQGPSTLTIEIEPGLREKYTRPIFQPGVFESLIRSGLIGIGGDLDEEPTYDTTMRYERVMCFLDDLRAEARRPSKGRKKGDQS